VVQRISEGLAAEAEIAVLTSRSRRLEFLYSEGDLPAGPEQAGGVTIDRLPQRRLPRVLRRALYAGAELCARRGLPGHGRLRALAVGPHLRGVVAHGARFRPRIVLGAAAPFATLWQAHRVARSSGAALALIPCLHADPQVDHPALHRLLRRADAVLTMTEYERLYLISLGIERDRVHRIGGGVDPAAPSVAAADLRAAWGLDPDRPIVLFAGRQEEGKGLGTLIDAMTRLWRAGSDALLVVAGASAPRTAIARAALDRLDASQRRNVLVRDDVEEAEKWGWYRECAVMAAPSRVDSLGLCYLEAWSCARPVIAARTGPQSELITAGDDGLLVAPGDAEELAGALERLLADPARAAAMGRRGRDRVLERHTWERVVERVRAVYASLARGAA
jgi:glycosyltransferase involved in cell wall biosynthesis